MGDEWADEDIVAYLRSYDYNSRGANRDIAETAADRIEELLQERCKLQCESADLATVLMGMVRQHCFTTGAEEADFYSAHCSANAEAMLMLAECGRLEIVEDEGRRVLANEVEDEN